MRAVSALTDAATAEEIGAFWLERVLEPVSSAGRRARDARAPFAAGEAEAARAAIAEVVEAAASWDGHQVSRVGAALRALPDPLEALARASAGGTLADVDLYEVARLLDALEALRACAGQRPPERLGPASFEPLRERLAPGVRRGGAFYLDDAFAEGLAQARAAARADAEACARERSRLRESAAAVLGDAVTEEREFALARADLPAVVPAGVRTVREAGGYVVFELANDERTLAAMRARDDSAARVAELEERARERLSREIGAHAPALLAELRRAGEIDLLRGAVAFAQAHAATAPQIADHDDLAIDEARLLPLEETLAAHGRPYAPISLSLPGQAVITGPNMGGKSAALRTAGFVQLCAQWGLPVAARGAHLRLVERICWLGSAQGEERADREGLLSSFGGEIVRLAKVLREPHVPRLLLIDEFARATSPREGRALVVALLDALRERGELALAATHFHGVAEAAGVAHYAVIGLRRALSARSDGRRSLEEALRLIGESMDYRLAPAASLASAEGDAIQLARLLGLDERVTARAARELHES
ncbi:MAG TPA: hypothetical protein VNJ51_01585 [Candidatus Dormibacteraeota bacterium]|nr:hypothetical protein [Candidatus Dormibacteraeota bacterium]